MAKIRPFQGVFYQREKVKDLAAVICPPYDVISPAAQSKLHQKDPHNFIHVDFRKDTPGEDKYAAAGAEFRRWLAEQVMVRDAAPAIYFHSHQYLVKGEKRIRLGFFALLHLGGRNFGHENTRSEAKEDRFKLIKQVKAHISPIFVMFEDAHRIVQRAYQSIVSQHAFLDFTDEEKNVHKVWRITDPALLTVMQERMLDENIFIADGHHRYEVACALRDEVKPKSADDPYNFVMAYFTNTESRGLTIMAIHRLLRLAAPLDIDKVKVGLNAYFEIEECKESGRFFFLMAKGGRSEHLIGMYYGKKYWLLRLRNIKILDKILADKPKEYRSLDVSILNALVLKKVFDVEPDDKNFVSYHHERDEVLSAVNADPRCVGFFLNPVQVEQILAVALAGHKMPPKSTFFYPKVPSGLLVNLLE